MAENKDKDLLLLNNKYMNISDYDKNLSYDALEGIISAKKNYAKAQQSNDTMGMAKANAYANSIRKQSGGYTGGDDGSAYYPTFGRSNAKRPEYKSAYADDINKIYNSIIERREFSYDLDSDPMYKLYKRVYEQAGVDAYNRALASKSVKTGGISNTNAASAAAQAQAYYGTQLAQKAYDMYNNMYSKYNDETKELYNRLNAARSLDSEDYSEYRNSVADYEDDRDFDYKAYRDNIDDANEAIRYDIETAYKKSRDDEADRKWLQEQEYNRSRDKANDEYQRERDYADDRKWAAQSETDRYNVLARLISSVYNKSNIGVDVDTIMRLLGL